jgi:hypothetical protein
MSDHRTELSLGIPVPADRADLARRTVAAVLRRIESREGYCGVLASVEQGERGAFVWIRHDESADIEHAETVARAVVEALETGVPTVCGYAHSGGRAELDAFGGGAFAVAPGRPTVWCDPQAVVREEIEAGKDGRWTVVLLYPDYMADGYPNETSVRHVAAGSPAQAVVAARREIADQYESLNDPADMLLVAVFPGFHRDWSDGEGGIGDEAEIQGPDGAMTPERKLGTFLDLARRADIVETDGYMLSGFDTPADPDKELRSDDIVLGATYTDSEGRWFHVGIDRESVEAGEFADGAFRCKDADGDCTVLRFFKTVSLIAEREA